MTVQLLDTTLYEGLQAPSITRPSLSTKLEILRLTASLGIQSVNLGFPASSDTYRLAQEAEHLAIQPICLAQALESDSLPIITLSQQVGIPIEMAILIGVSPQRIQAERWSTDVILERIQSTITTAIQYNLPVALALEDITRAYPQNLLLLQQVLQTAVEAGVSRLILGDTVGQANPVSTTQLISWIWIQLQALNPEVKLDWHGHNDLGLALANSLAAGAAGVTRIHGTYLGMGARAGQTSLELLLLNLKLMGQWGYSLETLDLVVNRVANLLKLPLPSNTPVVGQDVLTTTSGIQTAAMLKAAQSKDPYPDLIGLPYPPDLIGRHSQVDINYQSDRSTVAYYLHQQGVRYTEQLVDRILNYAQSVDQVLSVKEIASLVKVDFTAVAA